MADETVVDAATQPETPDAPVTEPKVEVDKPEGEKPEGETPKAEAPKVESAKDDPEETLVIDGAEVKMPRSTVKALAQKAQASEQRFAEAARIRDNVVTAIKGAAENPRDFLEKIGVDPFKFAHDLLYRKYKDDAMTPEQKKAREIEEKGKTFDQREIELREREDAIAQEQMNSEITNVLISKNMPTDALTVGRVARYVMAAKERKVSVTIDDILALVKEDIVEDAKRAAQVMSEDELKAALGDEKLAKLGVKKELPPNTAPQGTAQKHQRKGNKITWEELRDDIGKRFG